MADSMFHQPVMGRRAFVGGTLAASSMAFLAACGKKGGDTSGSESGSTLNFYINNPVCIDPYNVQEDQGTQVEYQLFDALTSYDAEKGEIVPLACESFEANDDATEFTFKIKKAKFHNGDDVTSKSFKLGWERLVNTVGHRYRVRPFRGLLSPSMVEGYDDLLAGNATELSGVTCPDDETSSSSCLPLTPTSPSSPLTRLWPRFPSAPSPMPRASILRRSVTARS
ncbi:MAG: ABC transporter substrate-binding protein [Collinsella aerofaciens]